MDFLKVAVIIAFVLLTFFTIRIHPEIHQPMIIEDADFKLTRISDTIKPTEIKVQEAPKTISQNTDIKSMEVKNVEVQNIKIQQPVKLTEQTIPEQAKPQQNTSQLELLQRIIKNTEEHPVEIVNSKPEQKPVQTTQKPTPVKQTTVNIEPQKTQKNPYMTEQEEIIAWNKWRSAIHNEIARNSNVDFAPLGTIFVFTFVVDKYGNVSNIKVECSNPNLIDETRRKIKPAIANLQRKPILNFPRGTQRTSTVVNGSFMISFEDRYSTPNDFSDYERIRH